MSKSWIALFVLAGMGAACGGSTSNDETGSGGTAASGGIAGSGAGPASGGSGTGSGGTGGSDGPTPCGARAGDTCSDDEYCAYEPDQTCGAADETSVCLPRPTSCDLSYVPVCGCDGMTYGNACAANAAGQGVLSEGECP